MDRIYHSWLISLTQFLEKNGRPVAVLHVGHTVSCFIPHICIIILTPGCSWLSNAMKLSVVMGSCSVVNDYRYGRCVTVANFF